MRPQRTWIDRVRADWTPEIESLWQKHVVPKLDVERAIEAANYFTPRDYLDRDHPLLREGFTYSQGPYRVYGVDWTEEKPT